MSELYTASLTSIFSFGDGIKDTEKHRASRHLKLLASGRANHYHEAADALEYFGFTMVNFFPNERAAVYQLENLEVGVSQSHFDDTCVIDFTLLPSLEVV